MKLLFNSNPIALWQEIIHEAEAACMISLKQELESYLVYLLVRYMNKPEIVKHIMASEFLKGVKSHPASRHLILQDVGDKCLLLSGLFPKISEKRLVKISYFVNLGQSAYVNISETHNDLFGSLSKQFVSLMDILQSVRQYAKDCPDLMPLQAYDLWNETGSRRALSVLRQYTSSIPITRR